jgi:hypothetical protein
MLSRARALHEFVRGAKQREILFVVGRVGAIDLYPLPRTGQSARPERGDIAVGEFQFGRGRHGQAQPDAVTADASEHPVADEVGVEAVNFSCADAGELKQQSVDLRFSGGLDGVGVDDYTCPIKSRLPIATPQWRKMS